MGDRFGKEYKVLDRDLDLIILEIKPVLFIYHNSDK